jgi:localization factor PodJL
VVSEPKSAGTTSASENPIDRRADFIAAARRAARAAAERVATDQPSTRPVAAPEAPQPHEPSREAKPGAFARISQAIRNRKRPLLLAAAAIVIAIGAMQIYGKLATTPDEPTVLTAVAPTPEADPAPATADGQFRDVVAEATAPAAVPTIPRATEAAMVAPAARPNAEIAFAEPEAFNNRFAISPNLPDSGGIGVKPAAEKDESQVASANEGGIDVEAPAAGMEPPPVATYASGLDPRLGSEKLLRAADEGDPVAAFEVARRYADGTVVAKDLAKAVQWYRRAAEGGVAVAQYRLASLYERGQGVARDRVEAANWYQRAADQGNVNAMHNLAVMMSEGVEGPPDHDKALQWFLAAGHYGVRDSQYNLGVIYARGLGPAQDLAESYKWFTIAAAQGDKDAAARRDEVAKAMSPEELTRAREAGQTWHVQPTLAEANGVAAPAGVWDGAGDGLAETDREALVRKIQILLAEQGYDPGPPDGVVGPKTADAVRAYQRRIGQPETGQIDGTLVATLADGAT